MRSFDSTKNNILTDAAGLVAVRKSDGQFLRVRISAGLPADVDYDDPEGLAREIWWHSAWPGAERAVQLGREMRAARRRRS